MCRPASSSRVCPVLGIDRVVLLSYSGAKRGQDSIWLLPFMQEWAELQKVAHLGLRASEFVRCASNGAIGLFPIEGVGPDFAVVGASVRG